MTDAPEVAVRLTSQHEKVWEALTVDPKVVEAVVHYCTVAHCVKAPGKPDMYWIHGQNMPFLGEGKTQALAWKSALDWLKKNRRVA